MKKSFILEKDSTFDRKQGLLTQRSGSDQNLGKFYFNFLNGAVGQKKKEERSNSENSDLFMSEECDEKRSFTPQPRTDSMLGK
jgi:hypothetical protein